ncbi:MAG: hypothetical protein VB071_06870 [Lawsonibacter sp.]|nr:hypothetical protein [Lawsonibacter sp.]
MKRLRIVLWYLGVACAALLLFFSFLTHNVLLTLLSVALTVVLKTTNRYVPIPKVYAQYGIKSEMLDGGKHEKNSE